MFEELKSLTPEQAALLRRLLQEQRKRVPFTRGTTVLEEEKIFEIVCTVKCQLCGVETSVTKKSSSPKDIVHIISHCPACKPRLMLMGAEALADMLIKMFTIEPPKIFYKSAPRRKEEEEEEEPTVDEVERAVDEILEEGV